MKWKLGAALPVLAAALLCFNLAVGRLDRGGQLEGKHLVEQALRRAAVSCYAAEGTYPPDVAYLQQHYGLQYDEQRYMVHYHRFASNLMPEITVVDLEQ